MFNLEYKSNLNHTLIFQVHSKDVNRFQLVGLFLFSINYLPPPSKK